MRQAIVLLGPRTVRQWAMLLLLSGIDEQRGPLLITALSRGRTCEAIARRLGADDPDAYFFTGMLSVVDALLDQPDGGGDPRPAAVGGRHRRAASTAPAARAAR